MSAKRGPGNTIGKVISFCLFKLGLWIPATFTVLFFIVMAASGSTFSELKGMFVFGLVATTLFALLFVVFLIYRRIGRRTVKKEGRGSVAGAKVKKDKISFVDGPPSDDEGKEETLSPSPEAEQGDMPTSADSTRGNEGGESGSGYPATRISADDGMRQGYGQSDERRGGYGYDGGRMGADDGMRQGYGQSDERRGGYGYDGGRMGANDGMRQGYGQSDERRGGYGYDGGRIGADDGMRQGYGQSDERRGGYGYDGGRMGANDGMRQGYGQNDERRGGYGYDGGRGREGFLPYNSAPRDGTGFLPYNNRAADDGGFERPRIFRTRMDPSLLIYEYSDRLDFYRLDERGGRTLVSSEPKRGRR